MNSPESHRDKVLFYGYLARPVRTELVRRAFHSDNDAVALAALKMLLDGVEKYSESEQTAPEDLSVFTQAQLLARAKQLVDRLEHPVDGGDEPDAGVAAVQQAPSGPALEAADGPAHAPGAQV